MKKNVYIVSICRTPVGSFGGYFKNTPAVELGSLVIKDVLKRGNVPAEKVDEVIFGDVLQAALGQNPARQASLKAGLPIETPAVTINKVCGSGLHAVTLAYRAILSGESNCVIAGGMENMSMAPYAIPSARWGARMNNATMIDVMVNDGLWDAFNNYHMGITAENVAEKYGITREMQDNFAVRSQNLAEQAMNNGWFDEEITPVTVPQRKGDPIVYSKDEHPRPGTTYDVVAKLKPAFKKDGGTVTAANASGINDGAAAVLVCSEEFVKENNLKPMLRIVSTGSKGVDPSIMGLGPIPSVRQALEKANMTIDDIDLVEANEAFASQALEVCKELNIPEDKVNVCGGAIALGHPIGASGARILTTLAYQMKRLGSHYGLATLCIGGGMGEAVIVERV